MSTVYSADYINERFVVACIYNQYDEALYLFTYQTLLPNELIELMTTIIAQHHFKLAAALIRLGMYCNDPMLENYKSLEAAVAVGNFELVRLMRNHITNHMTCVFLIVIAYRNGHHSIAELIASELSSIKRTVVDVVIDEEFYKNSEGIACVPAKQVIAEMVEKYDLVITA